MNKQKHSLSAKKGWRRKKQKEKLKKLLAWICLIIGMIVFSLVIWGKVRSDIIMKSTVDLDSTICGDIRVFHHEGKLNEDVCSYYRTKHREDMQKASIPSPTVEDQVKDILKKHNKGKEFQDKLLCLIRNESGFDPEAINLNRHSVDFGILQYNSKLSPIKISGKCMFDIECSIDKFVEYIDNGGSWDRWYGYKYNCK